MANKYGIHAMGANLNMTLYNRYKSGFTGWRDRLEWSGFETARNVFNNAFWIDNIVFFASEGKYYHIGSMPGPVPNTPDYLFGSPDLVPKITTDRGQYAHMINANYLTRLKNHWSKIKDLLLTLDPADYAFILSFQSAESSTGDQGTIKGTISKVEINGVQQSNPSSYLIDDQEWTEDYKRANLWPFISNLIATNLPGVRPYMNISNDGENYDWVLANMPGAWMKLGYPTHNYNIPGEKFQKQMIDALKYSAVDEHRFMGELDATFNLAWFQKASKKNLRTLIVSSIGHGMDITNIALQTMESVFGTDLSQMQWAGQYQGYRLPTETNKGFVVFRQAIDLADTTLYPEGTYGALINPASLNTYNRRKQAIEADTFFSSYQKLWKTTALKIQYLNPARVTAIRTLFPGSLYLTPDQDQDHNAYDNDYGVDLIAGSYEKFVHVINQETTCKPYWRQGPVDSYYLRFGLGFDVANGKNRISIYEEFTANGSYQVSILARFLDKGTGSFSVRYWNGTTEAIAGVIACANTNTIREEVFNIQNYSGVRGLTNSAHFALVYESGTDTEVFDSVEFTLIAINDPTNTPPTADAGANQTITLPTNTATLTGSGNDPDGTITGYLWQKISGPSGGAVTSPTSATTGITALQQGEYVYQLTVTDNDGDTGTDTVTINVLPADTNIQPVADAGPNQTIQLPVSEVTLNMSASYDPDGTITGYLWTLNQGPITPTILSPSAAITNITGLTTPGTYIFRGRVQDNDGNVKGDNVTITVLPPNNPPIVQINTPDTTLQLPEDSLTIDAIASDNDGAITSILWEQIEGTGATITSPTTAATSFEDLQAGINKFRLTATDDLGATNSAEITITVNDPEEEEDYLRNISITDLSSYELDGGIKALKTIPFAVNADQVTGLKANCTITLQYVDSGNTTFHVNCIRCTNRAKRVLSVTKTNTGQVKTAIVTVTNFKFGASLENSADFTIVGAEGTVFKFVGFVNNNIQQVEV